MENIHKEIENIVKSSMVEEPIVEKKETILENVVSGYYDAMKYVHTSKNVANKEKYDHIIEQVKELARRDSDHTSYAENKENYIVIADSFLHVFNLTKQHSVTLKSDVMNEFSHIGAKDFDKICYIADKFTTDPITRYKLLEEIIKLQIDGIV